jgi:hypothetical protein
MLATTARPKLLLLAYIPMVDFVLPLPVLPQKVTAAICSG